VPFRVLAFHYPRPEYYDEMVARIGNAAEVTAAVPGCVDVDCWRDEASGAVVSTAKFESKEDWRAALKAIAAANVDFAFNEREGKAREVYNLVEVDS
jgi:quinol monooxygenase YgiN